MTTVYTDAQLEIPLSPRKQREEIAFTIMGYEKMLSDTRKGWTQKRINNAKLMIDLYKKFLIILLSL